ncbi:hypothetical protein OD91_2223 [Lutibacter sp. Hel_I_33_5]|uniref:hypothetical protein n=1 Tax=Lutibacter sp. Hel_I_33_5 TaxID=1566289 RepID=UPI00119E88FD|nr:hypothetical protein [Lutibacter sp. Hel_I_33_5]TVZ56921.1 hypothetical protein OD91_2223 [Lutibacter sp. Hel_I_33_5]
MGIFDKLFNKKKEVIDFPPKPKWKPNLPIDLNLILEKSKYYTDKKIQIAVFENGTVIMFPERVSDINSSAIEILDKIYNAHPDFNPTEMDDGNYTIQYNEPAFNIVFKDEIENHWKYIDENHLDGICTAEVLINSNGEHNVFNEIGKICLFGRSKMFMDAQKPKVVLTFDNMKK